MLCTIAAPFKGDNGLEAVLNKNWLYSPAIGCTLPARGIASLNGILLIYIGVMSD